MKNLTEGNIYKTFILFAVPLILAGILAQAHNTIDSMIAGKYLGESGLAAIGGTASFITLVSSLLWGFNLGSSIATAMLFAAKDYKNLKTYLFNNLFVHICLNLLIMIFAFVFKEAIFDFLKLAPEIRADAAVYYYIICGGLVITSTNTMGILTMHAFGISSFPLKMSIMSMVLNIAGNIFSIIILKTGVAGVAVSTVLAGAVADICIVVKIKKCFKQMQCDDYKVKIDLSNITRAIRYGLPSCFQQSFMYIASIIVSPMVNAIGVSATAAYSVILRIYDINANIYQNSAKTLANYAAHCVGAGQQDKLKKGVKVGALQSMVFLTPVLLLCIIFVKPLCGAFFPSDYTGEALNYTIVFIKYFMPFIVFNVVNNLFHSFFRGIKANGMLMLFTAIGAITRVIASAIFVPYWGMYGIYAGWVVSWMFEAILVVVTYLSGVWKRAIEA